jgi:hypothetical protein
MGKIIHTHTHTHIMPVISTPVSERQLHKVFVGIEEKRLYVVMVNA